MSAAVSGAVSAAFVLAVFVAPPPAAAQLPSSEGGAPVATYVRDVLTAGGPQERLRHQGARVEMTAGAWLGLDHNRREVFYRRGVRPSRTQTSCATWVHRSAPDVQEGLAVRIRDDGDRVRAVTLTRNVEFGAYWVFNLLTWDTARTGDPWSDVGQFDLSGVVGRSAARLAPLPWRVCLRAVGRHVALKVWLPRRTGEPSWSDRTHVRRALLPKEFAASGVPGWYVGHLAGGQRVSYGDLRTR